MIVNRFNKFINIIELFRTFGVKYSVFRISYELKKKIGILKLFFPVYYKKFEYPGIIKWRKDFSDRFFVPAREVILSPSYLGPSEKLKTETEKILSGEILFFSTLWKKIGFENESFVHPISKYKYPHAHWTKLPIYSTEVGDIKYVWEKSKFSFLLSLIRNDLRNDTDNSEFVFNEIKRWIIENPPNTGPQYICSQEISIRLLNWSFALFFYQNSKTLDDNLLNDIFKSIEIQLDHIFNNINFSKIAVRNNHAVSETLTLYLISLYFPFLKNAKKYKELGKKWFQDEIDFQIFDDGSDSQYSFNYHRVKLQLLSWAISSARVNKEIFSECVYKKAKSSIEFLIQVVGNEEKGYLPNFGPNDGSIYFKLNDADYRNFIPQINALASLLDIEIPIPVDNPSREDAFWYMLKINQLEKNVLKIHDGFSNYNEGGYLHINDSETKTLFKTPLLKFRAAQNDLLHLDIWFKGVNVFKDSGSYSYNTDETTSLMFNGVAGHNTVSLNGHHHMFKGPRFIWLYKPEILSVVFNENSSEYFMQASMNVFYPKKYTIKRIVRKFKGKNVWEIEDSIIKGMSENDRIVQFWNLDNQLPFKVELYGSDDIERKDEIGYESVYYGVKSAVKRIILSTNSNVLKVRLEITL